MVLTPQDVRNLQAKSKPYKVSDSRALYLIVTEKGSKLWRFDYSFQGKRNTLSLGKWPDVTLAEARRRRDRARRRLAKGVAPRDNMKITVNSFERVALAWYEAARPAWTSRYAKLVLGRLQADIFPELGKEDIANIEPPRLLEVIRKIEARGAIEMAKRVKNLCSEISQSADNARAQELCLDHLE